MTIEQAMFAAGCFWGVEAIFARTPGVIETVVGYAGGHVPNPTYAQVCSDTTGHAETVWLRFDSNMVGYDALLDIFFGKHNPTLVNRQGPDIGSQYRSVIFYYNAEQQKKALDAIARIDASHKYQQTVVTEVISAAAFYRAEEYHQRYLEKNGGHCGM